MRRTPLRRLRQAERILAGRSRVDRFAGAGARVSGEFFRAGVVWRPAPSGSPRSFPCFEFPSPAEADAKYAELTGAGHRGLREPWDAFWGMRYATVLDPDGNGIDLYAALPAT
ncbi:VOC family protein [Thermomonospora amylolytica]|uniref:VOC family protein n=1 Tax=Thermomonospora amylolytica TaxID=1411117 RepID=UPI0018E4DFC8|nr:VOC family protein [Thermomonospora amylolytica]